jgi:hypothetical protein
MKDGNIMVKRDMRYERTNPNDKHAKFWQKSTKRHNKWNGYSDASTYYIANPEKYQEAGRLPESEPRTQLSRIAEARGNEEIHKASLLDDNKLTEFKTKFDKLLQIKLFCNKKSANYEHFNDLYSLCNNKYKDILIQLNQENISIEKIESLSKNLNDFLDEIKQKSVLFIYSSINSNYKYFIHINKLIHDSVKKHKIIALLKLGYEQHNYKAFVDEVLQCGRDHYTDTDLDPKSVKTAYIMYKIAKMTKNPDIVFTVIGRMPLMKDGIIVPSDENFPSLDQNLIYNLLGHNGTQRSGTILRIPDNDWTMLVNDAWLLGLIHAKREIKLGSPINQNNIWNANENRLTPFARELMCLASFGYKQHASLLEDTFICSDPDRAAEASLLGFKNAVRQLQNKDPENALDIIRERLSGIEP